MRMAAVCQATVPVQDPGGLTGVTGEAGEAERDLWACCVVCLAAFRPVYQMTGLTSRHDTRVISLLSFGRYARQTAGLVNADARQCLGRGGAMHELQLIMNVDLFGTAQDELSWQERALCAQTDPEAFFPEKGGSTRDAKKVCVGCEVRGECLEYALEHDERFGIWGGLSERERRKFKKDVV
jgi:WhiB family redox-sensing transcriptional regulator